MGIAFITRRVQPEPAGPDGLTAETALSYTSEIPDGYSSGMYWIKDRNGTPQNVYINMTDNGGRWLYLTNSSVTNVWGTTSYNAGTYAYSMQATQRGSGSSAHFGATVDYYGSPFDIKDVAVFHTGGCGYTCAGPAWNNLIHVGVGIVTDPLSSFYYPGWGLDPNGPLPVIKNDGTHAGEILCDGWNVYSTPTQANHRIHLGLGGYSSCTRATHTNIVAIRNYA